MKLILIVFSLLQIVNCQEKPIEGDCNNIGELKLEHNRGKNFGAIQVCLRPNIFMSTEWRYFSSNGAWTEGAARLACRQLNLGYSMSTASGNLSLSSDVNMLSIRDADCVEDAQVLYDCIQNGGMQQTAVTMNCVDCTDGAMRLVGGSTVSEGRLEICHNGQWGTICNEEWTHSRAAQVCSTLGLPTYNATLHQFNGGAGSVYTYNCPTLESDISNCIQESSCTHSMDVVGVKCLPFTDACAVPVDEAITTVETPPACNCQQPPKLPTTPPTIGKCTPAGAEGDYNEMATNTSKPESSITQSTVMSTSGTLGTLIGLLAVALVMVVTGWIVSCVYFQQKNNKKCKDHTHTTSASTSDHTLQLNNPVYDGSTNCPTHHVQLSWTLLRGH